MYTVLDGPRARQENRDLWKRTNYILTSSQSTNMGRWCNSSKNCLKVKNKWLNGAKMHFLSVYQQVAVLMETPLGSPWPLLSPTGKGKVIDLALFLEVSTPPQTPRIYSEYSPWLQHVTWPGLVYTVWTLWKNPVFWCHIQQEANGKYWEFTSLNVTYIHIWRARNMWDR